MNDPLSRALGAYFRTDAPPMGKHPSPADSGEVTFEGRLYVVLRNTAGELLAVYRVRNHDHVLKRLRWWPPQVVAR